MKGGLFLPGYIQILAYTSDAHIPLEDVAVTITATDGTAIAMRLTDRNGQAGPIDVPVPALSAGQSPDTGVQPFTAVDLYARLEGYEQILEENVQVFPQTVTRVNLEMIPLAQWPASWGQSVVFDTPAQNL